MSFSRLARCHCHEWTSGSAHRVLTVHPRIAQGRAGSSRTARRVGKRTASRPSGTGTPDAHGFLPACDPRAWALSLFPTSACVEGTDGAPDAFVLRAHETLATIVSRDSEAQDRSNPALFLLHLPGPEGRSLVRLGVVVGTARIDSILRCGRGTRRWSTARSRRETGPRREIGALSPRQKAHPAR